MKELGDWKTTIVGVFGAIVAVLVPLIQKGDVTLQELTIAAILAALGYVARGTKSKEKAKNDQERIEKVEAFLEESKKK